jgi:hypothetical protein
MIETDYLVIGAGATGLIFADEMLTHSDAQIVIVDRRFRPGGHWNDAYPFVKLHQPSAFYGAGSRELGSRRIETSGPNAGLFQQASGTEINAYFEQLMQERLLPSGRVRFLPLHEYWGDWSSYHSVTSLVNGEIQDIRVRRKLVDTTFYRISTPLTHRRTFEVAAGARVIPPGMLPQFLAPHRNYVVLGGGKTSMDVLIWLLEQGVAADSLTWIAPRDSWLINRETVQPGEAGKMRMVEGLANSLEAAAYGQSLDDIYDRLERSGELLRVDTRVQPGMFHQATISRGELELLRRVKNVVRGKHVRRVRANELVFDQGRMAVHGDTVFIDCTARGISFGPVKPVFEDSRITIQFIRDGRISFSAAAIGYVEAGFSDETQKNRLCTPIPYEEHLIAWPKAVLAELRNGEAWSRDPAMRAWSRQHRLAGFTSGGTAGTQLERLRERVALLRPLALANLASLVATHESEQQSTDGINWQAPPHSVANSAGRHPHALVAHG